MSADNGVYIGKFPTENGGFEYRVAAAQAIENCDDSSIFPSELTDSYRVWIYSKSTVFSDYSEAFGYAKKVHEEEEKILGFTEYGICSIDYNRPYPKITSEEAYGVQDKFWKGLI